MIQLEDHLFQMFPNWMEVELTRRNKVNCCNDLVGGADEVRTRDLLRDRQLKTIYLVGLSSFTLRHIYGFGPNLAVFKIHELDPSYN